MISLIISILVLVVGYFVYGKIVEKVFGADDRKTPAVEINDGVDCVPLPTWKAFLIELLNIAGTGPIFGALMGAVFGPIVFLWIVLGAVLGGAVHDYMCGMISCRESGASISEIVGKYLGRGGKTIMSFFTVILLILVGATFTTSPAVLIATLTPEWMNKSFWLTIILIYYLLATILPIDKLIGRIYPVFGVILIIMAVGIFGGLIFGGYSLPEIDFLNNHPDKLFVFPYMFITVACGAISGFHATQAPMMSKCIVNEKSGRLVFYGAMLTESIIALVWAAAGVAFYGSTGGLQRALSTIGQSGVVYNISVELLGIVGGAIAVIGVVICPISSGDTAFRSARLTIADWFKIDQKTFGNRFKIAIPLLVVGAILTQLDFNIIWRYFSWANQTLAMIALWTIGAYIVKEGQKKIYSLIATVPAAFMTGVTVSYILMAEEGFRLNPGISYLIGIGMAAIFFIMFMVRIKSKTKP